jgi:hypothetical protein
MNTATTSNLATTQDWLTMTEGTTISGYALTGYVITDFMPFGEPQAVRYASPEKTREAANKVFTGHAGLFEKLAR